MRNQEWESSEHGLLARQPARDLLARGLRGDEPADRDLSSLSPDSGTDRTPNPTPANHSDRREASFLAALFPEYQFEAVLSRGGFGVVYRAAHRHMRRPMAVKILARSITGDVVALARFEREIAAVGRLDHPGIVRAFEAGRRGEVWFLAMELVDGLDLGTLTRALGPLPFPEACELIRQAALALDHAHRHGLVHRDVKPGNLMLSLTPAGQPVVKVLDFGLVQATQTQGPAGDFTLSSEFLGTIDYAAPEQIENPREADARADVYGLGATCYRLLCGRAPHADEDSATSFYTRLLRVSQEPAPSIALRRAGLPPELVAVVDQLLARDPKRRIASCAEAALRLAPFAIGARLDILLADARARQPAGPAISLPPSTSQAPLMRARLEVPPPATPKPLPPLKRSSRGRVAAVGFVLATLALALAQLDDTALRPTSSNRSTLPRGPRFAASAPHPIQTAWAPGPVPTDFHDTLLVDARTAPRLLTPGWRLEGAYRLGTPRATQVHPTSGWLYYCGGDHLNSLICTIDPKARAAVAYSNLTAHTLAIAANGQAMVWSDRKQGALGRVDLSTGSLLAGIKYRGAGRDHSPLGVAFPPATWQGHGFAATDALVADDGPNGSKGLWRVPFSGEFPVRIEANGHELDQPVAVAFGRRGIFVANRVADRAETSGAHPDDLNRRLFRLAGDRLVACTTDQPVTDPCALAADPRSDDLYLLCGNQLPAEARHGRLLLLRPLAQPDADTYQVTELVTGFRQPTDGGLGFSPDGQQLILTESAGELVSASFIYRFHREPL